MEGTVDHAAFYRLSALYDWDDFIYTHISARVPEHHFLIKLFGLMFEEITASSLVKVDLDGNVLISPKAAQERGTAPDEPGTQAGRRRSLARRSRLGSGAS
ncbi:MAG TPA: class II aldolase/adducin family protein [Sphingobium sp.]|uniref:class II aldolase/adducin family protein n=1 Tax=Sphingobium sp. TaxID=1912891 RepID=UPI002ED35A3C